MAGRRQGTRNEIRAFVERARGEGPRRAPYLHRSTACCFVLLSYMQSAGVYGNILSARIVL